MGILLPVGIQWVFYSLLTFNEYFTPGGHSISILLHVDIQ